MSHFPITPFRFRPIKTPSIFSLCIVLIGLIPSFAAFADPDLSEHGSVSMSAAATISTVGISVEALASVPQLSVAGVEVSAEGAIWLLRGIAEGSGEALEISVKVAGGASMVVGTTLEVVTSAAGSLLVASGEALAFIPNEAGAVLYYSDTWNQP